MWLFPRNIFSEVPPLYAYNFLAVKPSIVKTIFPYHFCRGLAKIEGTENILCETGHLGKEASSLDSSMQNKSVWTFLQPIWTFGKFKIEIFSLPLIICNLHWWWFSQIKKLTSFESHLLLLASVANLSIISTLKLHKTSVTLAFIKKVIFN